MTRQLSTKIKSVVDFVENPDNRPEDLLSTINALSSDIRVARDSTALRLNSSIAGRLTRLNDLLDSHFIATGTAAQDAEFARILCLLGKEVVDVDPANRALGPVWELRFKIANSLFKLANMATHASRRESLRATIYCFDRTLIAALQSAQHVELLKIRTNRANALKRLAETLEGTEKRRFLDEAIQELESARKEVEPAAFPYEWVVVTMNLGNTHGMIADNTTGVDHINALELAEQIYDSALAVTTDFPDRASMRATIQMNRANVVARQGDLLGGKQGQGKLEEAIRGYEEARGSRKAVEEDSSWAVATINLANAQLNLAHFVGGERARLGLVQAVANCDTALESLPLQTMPHEWAATHLIRSVACMKYPDFTDDAKASIESLSQAIEGFEATYAVYARDSMPYYWAAASVNLAISKMRLADYLDGQDKQRSLRDAVGCFELVLEQVTHAVDPFARAAALHGRSLCLQSIARLLDRSAARSALRQAILGFEESNATVFTKANMPAVWAMGRFNLANAAEDLGNVSGRQGKLEAFRKASSLFRDVERFHSGGPSLPAIIDAHRNCVRMEAKMANWPECASYAWRAVSNAAAALIEAQSSNEVTERLNKLTGVGDICAHAYLQQGNASKALRAIEAGRVHILREEIAQQEAKLSAQDRARYIALKERLLSAQDANDSLSKFFNSISGIAYQIDHRSNFDATKRELSEARAAFQTFAKHAGISRKPVPTQAALLAGVSGLGEKGAAVVISVSTHGTAIFVLPYGLPRLSDATVRNVPSFTTTTLSNILSSQEDSWLPKYTEMQVGLRRAAQMARTGNHQHSLRQLANVFSEWNTCVEAMLPHLWKSLIRHVDHALRNAGVPSGSPVNLIVPGRLSILPLHAAGQRKGGGWHTFSDDWEVSYVPSLQILATLRRRAKRRSARRENLLAVTDPLGDLHITTNPAVTAFEPSAVKELKGPHASRQSFLKAVNACRYASFFCHGIWDNSNPDNSALILAKGSRFGVKDLRTTRLDNCRLVALGACQSGLTSIAQSPDEHHGLPAAFLQAGAASVVATHWPMLTSTIEPAIRELFQRQVRQGERPAAALCDISKEFRAGQLASPKPTSGFAAMTPFGDESIVGDNTEAVKIFKNDAQKDILAILTDHTRPIHWAGTALYGV